VSSPVRIRAKSRSLWEMADCQGRKGQGGGGGKEKKKNFISNREGREKGYYRMRPYSLQNIQSKEIKTFLHPHAGRGLSGRGRGNEQQGGEEGIPIREGLEKRRERGRAFLVAGETPEANWGNLSLY